MTKQTEIKSVIFIRRDNIGDLVCTTPAIRAVRLAYPDARIGVLVNSYNAEVIRNNPDINEIFVYEKWKHAGGKTRPRVWFENWRELRRVRAAAFEAAIGCSYAWSDRLARLTKATGARMRVGVAPKEGFCASYTDAIQEAATPIHEVEAIMRLVGPLGVVGAPPALVLLPDPVEVKSVKRKLEEAGMRGNDRLVAIHISSRREQNRWPKDSFVMLADMLQTDGARVVLLWSPGASNNPLHPGDDDTAREIVAAMKRPPLAIKTERLGELIASLSLVDNVVCCDGGAMHIAAGLGKPIVTIWGSTDERRWRPWGTPHIILKNDGKASATKIAQAYAACNKLFSRRAE